MRVLVAIDSFKGSMTFLLAGEAAKQGILTAIPDAEVVVRPLADGGEGTTDALIWDLGGERVTLTVTGPDGQAVTCSYGIIRRADKSQTAVMEMAVCCRYYACTQNGEGAAALARVASAHADRRDTVFGNITTECGPVAGGDLAVR